MSAANPGPESSTSPDPTPSPSGSMAGWSLKIWLAKNKSELKAFATFAVGLGSAWISANLAGNWALLIGGAFGLVTKLGLDALDYYLTANPA